MDGIVDALADQNAELASLLAGRSEDDAHGPSACDGWTVADVVLHLAQTNEMARASVEGRLFAAAADAGWMTTDTRTAAEADGVDPIDAAADLSVARERDQPWIAIRDRWQESVVTMQDAFRAADPSARVTWVAGEMAARTLATTRLAETWIHTGDVAAGFGVTVPPSDRLRHVVRLAWRTLPYAFRRAGRPEPGSVAFDLAGPWGDRWTFGIGEGARTTIRGTALDLCLVASRRVAPRDTGLTGEGPDADAVLELVRTWA
jgi:uncharacterized protein (TIGR03084 family)